MEQCKQEKPKQKHQPTRAAMVGTHSGNASATKRGPGRYHSDGHQKATPPKHEGAGYGFALHVASAAKKARKAAIKAGSVRQYKRARSAPLRAQRLLARAEAA